jgi:putative transcriptional regulator
MKKKEMSSLGYELASALEGSLDYVKGNRKLRTTQYSIPELPKIGSEDIKRIRNKLELTQEAFSLILGVSKKTVEAWESGRNSPQGPASRVISMLDKQPGILKTLGVKIKAAV